MSIPIEEFIRGACNPTRYEPDLALNLEVCEMINKRQANAPREAAMTIVHLVNSRNIGEAMLALTLLDHCVKNCGYPFHLQIATKEFLNELVRKFPERPAPFPNPVTQRVLYFIKEWKVALVDMSRHKDDLGHIKDMYRLLRLKGYRFPELRESSLAALVPSETLKSAQELEEEDRQAQSAKLQELVRRGRPQDLVEANHLMKVMTGFYETDKPDYKQKFEEELHKIQERAILLYEMLEILKPGDTIERNDTINELKEACVNAQPKIQKMITEEEDTEKIENLLQLNDMINNVMSKWSDVKKGIFDTMYEISGKQPMQTTDNKEPHQAISLIDLDDAPPLSSVSQTSSPVGSKQSAMNELSDLFGIQASITPNGTEAASADFMSPFSGISTPPSRGTAGSSTPGSASLSSQPPTTRPAQSPSPLPTSASTPPLTTSTDPFTLVRKNGLHVQVTPVQRGTQWELSAHFSNESTAAMDKVRLQLAVPKSMTLTMQPPSSTVMAAKASHAITQSMTLLNPHQDPIRLRYIVTYHQSGTDMELRGDYQHSPS